MSSTSTRLPTQEAPNAGHWLAEQAPDQMLTALRGFLEQYREDGGGLR